MSEFQLYPSPSKEQYDDYLIRFDDTVVMHGGALQYVRNKEFRAVHGSEVLFHQVKAAGSVAIGLEPRKFEEMAFVDPLMLATHSFKRGILFGFEVVDNVSGEGVSLSRIISSMTTGFHHEELAGQQGVILEEIPILEWGRVGLNAMGEVSQDIVRLWSENITDIPQHQLLVQYGIGAVVATNEALMENQSRDAIEDYFKQPDWSRELEQILTSNTGE